MRRLGRHNRHVVGALFHAVSGQSTTRARPGGQIAVLRAGRQSVLELGRLLERREFRCVRHQLLSFLMLVPPQVVAIDEHTAQMRLMLWVLQRAVESGAPVYCESVGGGRRVGCHTILAELLQSRSYRPPFPVKSQTTLCQKRTDSGYLLGRLGRPRIRRMLPQRFVGCWVVCRAGVV